MTLTITVEMDNAAFFAEGSDEVRTGTEPARILRKLAGRIEGADMDKEAGGLINDLNGNKVGRWDIAD